MVINISKVNILLPSDPRSVKASEQTVSGFVLKRKRNLRSHSAPITSDNAKARFGVPIYLCKSGYLLLLPLFRVHQDAVLIV